MAQAFTMTATPTRAEMPSRFSSSDSEMIMLQRKRQWKCESLA
jgi:hypothetical protein